jgi:hypothetical protein
LSSGLVYGTLNAAFSGLMGEYDGAWNDAALWLRIAGEFAFRSIFFGIFLSGTVTYLLNPRANPRTGSARAGAFEVGQENRYAWSAWLMAMLAAAMFTLSLGALFGRGPFASVVPFAAVLFLAVMSARLCWGMVFAVMFRATVTPEAVTLRGLCGSKLIARDTVMEVRESGILEHLVGVAFGPALVVSWRDTGGAVRKSRIPSTPEFANIDRLRAWLDDAIEAGRAR